LLLGRILTLQNRSEAAIPHLRAAVEAEPSSAEAHSFLADAYEKAGDSAAEARERDRAAELEVRLRALRSGAAAFAREKTRWLAEPKLA
jgi:Flp pilus assembly protein TadD